MIRFAPILLILVFFAGCDAISHTKITVQSKQSADSLSVSSEITDIVSKIASQYGLKELPLGGAGIEYSDATAGKNPGIWLTVNDESNPVKIEIAEMYIAHPTEIHKRIVDSLVKSLNAAGLDVKLVYQTPGPGNFWLILIFCVATGFVVWRLASRRKSKTTQLNAT